MTLAGTTCREGNETAKIGLTCLDTIITNRTGPPLGRLVVCIIQVSAPRLSKRLPNPARSGDRESMRFHTLCNFTPAINIVNRAVTPEDPMITISAIQHKTRCQRTLCRNPGNKTNRGKVR